MVEKFLGVMAEALDKDVGGMALSDVFRDYDEWDSIAVLSVMATIEEHYGLMLSRTSMEQCTTLEDLMRILPN